MTTKKITAAEQEMSYLKHNAIFCLLLGFVISGDFFYILLTASALAGWVTTLITLLYMVLALLMVSKLFEVGRYSRGSTKKAFWYGDFKDEFCAFLNQKGYKYSFNTFFALLLGTWAFANISDFSHWAESIELKHYAAVLMSAGSWSYALPVLLGLRTGNE